VQEKTSCNKINEIREERIANLIYTGSATSRAYVQSSSNPLDIFHYPCKFFTIFEYTLGSLTLVFKFLTHQETNNLLITTEFSKDEQIDFFLLEQMIQFEVPKRILFQEFDQSCLERSLKLISLRIFLFFFEVRTHIYIGPLCLFKTV